MPTTDQTVMHRVVAGDSLNSIAERHGLPGPYALYFAPGNRELRQRHPDPTRIPHGIELAIPREVGEQRAGLLEHLQRMEAVRGEVERLRMAMLERLAAPGENLPGLIEAMLRNLLGAIAALKFADSGMSHANHALALAGLEQRPPVTPAIARDALNQCRLAAAGVYWLIENPAAQAWCDVGAPNFWGRAAIEALAAADDNTPAIDALGDRLAAQYQLAASGVKRSVDTVIGDLIGEINRLEANDACPLR